MIDFMIPMWAYPILVWTMAWKAVAAWKAARKGHLIWFIAFFVVNTMGILPIIYIFIFQKMKFPKKSAEKKAVKKSKKKVKKAPAL